MNRKGFTLIELLVATAILAVIVGLAASPVREAIAVFVMTRQEAAQLAQQAAVLDLISRDIRGAARVREVGARLLELEGQQGEFIRWEVGSGRAARTVNGLTTPFPVAFVSFLFVPRESVPATRYILLRAELRRGEVVERGAALRIEPAPL